jgi:hypothetical protein
VKPERLFTDLSVALGFTLPVEVVDRLRDSPPATVDAFTDEVLRSEGLDPLTTDNGLRNQVRALVAEYMGEPTWEGRRGSRRQG